MEVVKIPGESAGGVRQGQGRRAGVSGWRACPDAPSGGSIRVDPLSLPRAVQLFAGDEIEDPEHDGDRFIDGDIYR